ncbi:hypothetical protein [Pelagicoccus mobilis]|uniref:Uncharacterized protein n=1 Tax=Pelagicoccus mobilis TaxID=415221 RepID=A0A934S0F1_9BACT|nr:hypothetical protein [Pelagicoccus mobilis]MBK1878895.1 hypothetical protein [Pelagicoccus mobilis]
MKIFSVLAVVVLSPFFCAASDYMDSVLTNLQGVGLEIRELNVQSDIFKLEYQDIESHALETLQRFDVRLLTAMELDVMPGQPYLEISIDVAHAQGPSHLYMVKLELREMAKLERPRDRVVTMSLPTWERKVMGVANRPEALTEELDRLLRLFSDEFHMHNVKEE